jgi:hypothetical protein
VRIGEPARKHGVSEADILHAVRIAIRKIDMDDDLTMLIGPARDGTPLEIGVLDLNGEDPVIIHAMRLRPRFYPLIRQG